MCEDIGNIPDELDHHDGECCTYACWSTEPRTVTNATAFKIKGRSRWAAQAHTVTLVANTIFGCTCDYYIEEGLCRHIEHVIETDSRGCVRYQPLNDEERINELKAYTRARRKQLYAQLSADTSRR